MYPINPDLIKAEIEYRQNQYRAVTKQEQEALLLMTDEVKFGFDYTSPIRHKIGKLLINWGMQLIGNTK